MPAQRLLISEAVSTHKQCTIAAIASQLFLSSTKSEVNWNFSSTYKVFYNSIWKLQKEHMNICRLLLSNLLPTQIVESVPNKVCYQFRKFFNVGFVYLLFWTSKGRMGVDVRGAQERFKETGRSAHYSTLQADSSSFWSQSLSPWGYTIKSSVLLNICRVPRTVIRMVIISGLLTIQTVILLRGRPKLMLWRLYKAISWMIGWRDWRGHYAFLET